MHSWEPHFRKHATGEPTQTSHSYVETFNHTGSIDSWVLKSCVSPHSPYVPFSQPRAFNLTRRDQVHCVLTHCSHVCRDVLRSEVKALLVGAGNDVGLLFQVSVDIDTEFVAPLPASGSNFDPEDGLIPIQVRSPVA